jgi:hypothetical protein
VKGAYRPDGEAMPKKTVKKEKSRARMPVFEAGLDSEPVVRPPRLSPRMLATVLKPPTPESDPEFYRKVQLLAGYGLRDFEICDVLGLRQGIFKRNKEFDQYLMEAMRIGNSVAQSRVGEALFKKALSGDVNAIRWYEQSRFRRTERVQVEVGGVVHLEIEQLDPEIRERRLRELQSKIGEIEAETIDAE